MFFSTVCFQFWVDKLHQGVPLHQHVSEGGAGEDPHNFGAERRQVLETAGKYFVHSLLVTGSHGYQLVFDVRVLTMFYFALVLPGNQSQLNPRTAHEEKFLIMTEILLS